MTEGTKPQYRETKCFSYEVTMVIQILAETEEAARQHLDSQGGFVSRREVTLKDAVSVFSGQQVESDKDTEE